MTERPLDFLEQVREKRVFIKSKNTKEIIGILKAFDLHLSIWISDVEIGKKKFSDLLIRGILYFIFRPILHRYVVISFNKKVVFQWLRESLFTKIRIWKKPFWMYWEKRFLEWIR